MSSDWLQAVCFYNCMENMERFRPSHTPSWTVWRIYALVKKTISTSYFIKEIENVFSRVPIRNGNTSGSLGEREILPTFSQISTRVYITVWKHGKCSLFLKWRGSFRYRVIIFFLLRVLCILLFSVFRKENISWNWKS